MSLLDGDGYFEAIKKDPTNSGVWKTISRQEKLPEFGGYTRLCITWFMTEAI